MTGTPLQSALRETRAMYRSRAALTTMTVLGLVAGLTGPFGTFETLSLPLSVLYWLLVALLTGGIGTFGAVFAEALTLRGRAGPAARIAVMALGAALPVTLAVLALSALFFQASRSPAPGAATLFVYCLGVSLAVFVVLELVVAPSMARPGTGTAPAAPEILKRLPPAARGALSHMSMADHYVEIHTERGHAMVLMRLSDAIKETRGTDGLQIHRSHWVARDAVRGFKRENGRTMLELKDGTCLPVSRSFLAPVRATLGN